LRQKQRVRIFGATRQAAHHVHPFPQADELLATAPLALSDGRPNLYLTRSGEVSAFLHAPPMLTGRKRAQPFTGRAYATWPPALQIC
jgi:hypothetical protein